MLHLAPGDHSVCPRRGVGGSHAWLLPRCEWSCRDANCPGPQLMARWSQDHWGGLIPSQYWTPPKNVGDFYIVGTIWWVFNVRGMGLHMELHSFRRCSIGSSVEEAEHQQQPQKFEEGPVLEEIHQGRSQGCQRRLMAPVGGSGSTSCCWSFGDIVACTTWSGAFFACLVWSWSFENQAKLYTVISFGVISWKKNLVQPCLVSFASLLRQFSCKIWPLPCSGEAISVKPKVVDVVERHVESIFSHHRATFECVSDPMLVLWGYTSYVGIM